MNEKIIVSSFPQFQKLSRTKVLAETATVEIAGNQIIIAAADRPTLISVLNGIAPDVDWSAEESNPITIAFLKLHPRHPCSS